MEDPVETDATSNMEQGMPRITVDARVACIPSDTSAPFHSVEAAPFGRGKRASGPRRVFALSTRLTQSEFNDLRASARAAAMPPTVFLRACALGQRIESRPPVPAVNAQTYNQLGHIGSNLNQIAAKLNSRRPADAAAIVNAIGQLVGAIKTIRGQLLGSAK